MTRLNGPNGGIGFCERGSRKFARTLPGRTAHPWEIVQKGHERPKLGGIVANVDCEVLERKKCRRKILNANQIFSQFYVDSSGILWVMNG